MPKVLFIITLSLILFSCQRERPKGIVINSVTGNTQIDSIYISQVPAEGDKYLAVLSPGDKHVNINSVVKHPVTARIYTKDDKKSYDILLTPGKELDIIIENDSTLHTNNLSDSLLNYITSSTLPFLNENLNILMGKDTPKDTVVKILDDFRLKRDSVINVYADKLTGEETGLIKLYNSVRVNNFLLYYGLVFNDIDPGDAIFDFTERIDHNAPFFKGYYNLALLKLMRGYLVTKDAPESIGSFLDYVNENTVNKELRDWYKVCYVKELIEHSGPWRKHLDKFSVSVLKDILQKEKSNRFYNDLREISEPYLLTRNGEMAYDFEAEQINGESIKLSDFSGSIVFIDVWTTWCGPCKKQRPEVMAMAEKYKDNPEVKVLMISVDNSKKAWDDYIRKQPGDFGTELYAEGGFKGDFVYNYSIHYVPRYMVIDKDGTIINSRVEEASDAIDIIETLMAENQT
ncbi:TlpA family protein disulfide reductase [Sinomicrobium sp. M5D2P17]